MCKGFPAKTVNSLLINTFWQEELCEYLDRNGMKGYKDSGQTGII